MKPDLVSVVIAHVVYFCAFARSEIFQKNARKSVPCEQLVSPTPNERESRGETNFSQGRKSVVGHGKFDAGVNGLTNKLPKHKLSHCLASLSPPQKIGRLNFFRILWEVRQERHDLKANFSLR